MNVKIKAIDKDTISVDGELFYRCDYGDKLPYSLFNTLKAVVHYNKLPVVAARIVWNRDHNCLNIPVDLFLEKDSPFRSHYTQNQSAFFTKKSADFVKRLVSNHYGTLTYGPEDAIECRKVVPKNNLPKVIRFGKLIYYYYEKICT